MKRAILYCGHLRTFKYCVKNHAEIFGPSDVYFSLWDKPGYIDRINDPWHSMMPDREAEVTEARVSELTPPEFNIKAIKIEDAEKVVIPYSLKKNNYLIWQYYKIKDCFELINERYDEIIRMRCDIMLGSFRTQPDKLTCSYYVWYNQRYDGYRMNEMVFAGNYDLMKKACNIIDNIPAINAILPELYLFYGESIFYQHLKLENLIDSIHFHDMRWRVLR